MVRLKFILTILFCISVTITSWAQKRNKEISCFISMEVVLSDDTTYVGDTLWINIDLRNVSKKPVQIFPEGIIFIEFESPVLDNLDLIQISERVTKRKERTIKPNEIATNIYPILIKEDVFRKGLNEFRINHITYPYWLSKKERSSKIYGKITSDVSTLHVL